MPYPFHILENEKLPASSHDVETFIRHALGQHWFIVVRQNLDETSKRFYLYFWQRHIGLDRYMDGGEIGKVYWGGAEIIEWSDSTEIVRMWPATPDDWYIGEFSLNKDKIMEERFEQLEELSNEIRKQFMKPANGNQNAAQAAPQYHISGDYIAGDKTMIKNEISIAGSNVYGSIVAADSIRNSLNKIESAKIRDDLKEQLMLLNQAVGTMINALPKEKAEEAADDMKRLAEEATKESPNKKWYSVSIEGLIKAAEDLDQLGEPVINLSRKVLALLTLGVVK